MPFYVVEQKGVPGKRLVDADKPASALSHVVQDSFTVTKVDGRALLDAVLNDKCVVEVAGGPKEELEPEKVASEPEGGKEPASEPELQTQRVENPVDPDDHKIVTEPDPDAQREDRQDRQLNGAD